MFLCIAIATSTYAQITVDSVGKVVIGDTAIVQKTTTRPKPQTTSWAWQQGCNFCKWRFL